MIEIGPSTCAVQLFWSIIPLVVKVISVRPPSILYHIVSRLGSEISTSKLGEKSPNSWFGLGEIILIVGDFFLQNYFFTKLFNSHIFYCFSSISIVELICEKKMTNKRKKGNFFRKVYDNEDCFIASFFGEGLEDKVLEIEENLSHYY